MKRYIVYAPDDCIMLEKFVSENHGLVLLETTIEQLKHRRTEVLANETIIVVGSSPDVANITIKEIVKIHGGELLQTGNSKTIENIATMAVLGNKTGSKLCGDIERSKISKMSIPEFLKYLLDLQKPREREKDPRGRDGSRLNQREQKPGEKQAKDKPANSIWRERLEEKIGRTIFKELDANWHMLFDAYNAGIVDERDNCDWKVVQLKDIKNGISIPPLGYGDDGTPIYLIDQRTEDSQSVDPDSILVGTTPDSRSALESHQILLHQILVHKKGGRYVCIWDEPEELVPIDIEWNIKNPPEAADIGDEDFSKLVLRTKVNLDINVREKHKGDVNVLHENGEYFCRIKVCGTILDILKSISEFFDDYQADGKDVCDISKMAPHLYWLSYE